MKISREDIVESLTITNDLRREFESQSAHYAHWAWESARAQDTVRRYEEKKELLFYSLYREYREAHPKDSKENDCKAYVRRNPEYKEVTAKLLRAQYHADVLKGAVRSWEMRRDMLIQLGAQFRHEADAHSLGAQNPKASREQKIRQATNTLRRTATQKRRSSQDGD